MPNFARARDSSGVTFVKLGVAWEQYGQFTKSNLQNKICQTKAVEPNQSKSIELNLYSQNYLPTKSAEPNLTKKSPIMNQIYEQNVCIQTCQTNLSNKRDFTKFTKQNKSNFTY